MATSTSRLSLRVPELTDSANIVTDYSDNLDDIDRAVGAISCTSGARPTSPFSGMVAFETDTGNSIRWTGTAWQHLGVATVSATSQITVPRTGQLILLTTDNLLYRYNGTAWVTAISTGTGNPDGGLARYDPTGPQSIANNSDVFLNFPTAVTSTTDVTKTTDSTFTINRAGTWFVEAQVAWGDNAVGNRSLHIVDGANNNIRYSGNVIAATSRSIVQCGTMVYLTSGTTIRVMVGQTSGAALSTGVESWGAKSRLTLKWVSA